MIVNAMQVTQVPMEVRVKRVSQVHTNLLLGRRRVSHALKIQTQTMSLDLHTSLSVSAISGILASMAVHV